jgi:hypothetical protein
VTSIDRNILYEINEILIEYSCIIVKPSNLCTDNQKYTVHILSLQYRRDIGIYIVTCDPSRFKSYCHVVLHISAVTFRCFYVKQDPNLNHRICFQQEVHKVKVLVLFLKINV